MKKTADKFSKIVIFSDLHVSPKTIDVCLEVLNEVHRVAVERGAVVGFLGDFWDVRGILPVDCVNRILDCFAGWEVPCFMIPGNHDQVTIGGDVHALTVLNMADNKVKVFTEPTLFADILWVPYRRKKEEVLEAIDCFEGDYMALFLHVDIIGAWMNGLVKAERGIMVSELPGNIPTYTGHYHRPHTVEEAVVYVGSQYEVSRSEAGDKKRVLVLDRECGYAMEHAEEVFLDVGPKHLDARFVDGEIVVYSGENVFEPRPGDRVRVHTNDPKKTKSTLKKFSADGVSSEVVVETKKVKSRIDNSGNMDPIALLKAFMDNEGTPCETAQLALDIIKRVSGGSA